MYAILAAFALGQLLLVIYWWSYLRTYVNKYYPSIKWPATISGTLFLVIFIGMEKSKVNHQLNLALTKKIRFYDKLDSSQEGQQHRNHEYRIVCNNYKNLKERSKRMGKYLKC